jgi:hypothetical protein
LLRSDTTTKSGEKTFQVLHLDTLYDTAALNGNVLQRQVEKKIGDNKWKASNNWHLGYRYNEVWSVLMILSSTREEDGYITLGRL